MPYLLDTIFSFIAPHQCLGCGKDGLLLCEDCQLLLPDAVSQCYRCHRTDGGSKTCKSCRRVSSLEHVLVRTEYEGVAESLLHRLKFERAVAAGSIVAQTLSRLELPSSAVLVPVPTATSRVRRRGYDQSVVIARQLAKRTSQPTVQLLERYGQQRQTGSGRSQRLKQLEGAFGVVSKSIPDHVLLVDDVITTGASLEVAAQTLKQAGVRHVSAIVFARAV